MTYRGTPYCKGCSTQYETGVWISEEGLCSKCYHINQHSDIMKWDGKMWVSKKSTLERFM